jgi:hypothetical protein
MLAFTLALVLAAGSCGNLHADVKNKGDEKKKNKEGEFLPEARDGAATFTAGQKVDVEISAAVGTLKQVEFVIRQQPENGTLSAPRPHPRDNNKSIVSYKHNGGDAPLTDKFTFACRVGTGPYSAPGTIVLTGRKFEPSLEIVNMIGSDRVFLGDESSLKFTVKNSGAAKFEQNIAWLPPWRGPPNITLKAGETREYEVTVKPEKTGTLRYEFEIQSGVPESKLSLYAECVYALTVSPSRLLLVRNAETGARAGKIELSNGRAEAVQLELRMPDRLLGGGRLEIKGNAKTSVPVSLPPSDVRAFRGEVAVISTQGLQVVTVESPARPAELKVVSSENGALDLGRIEAEKEAHGEIKLRNVGGVAALVDAAALPPLVVTPANQAVRVEPGDEVSFAVTLRSDRVGVFSGEVKFSGGAGLASVPVRVEVLPAKAARIPAMQGATAARAVTPAPAPQGSDAANQDTSPEAMAKLRSYLLAYLAANGLPVDKDKINPYLERIKQVWLVQQTASSVTIAWKKPDVAPARWAIELATVSRIPDTARFVKTWSPLKNWEAVETEAGSVGAKIHPVPAGSQFEIRIMAVDRDGKVSEPTDPIVLRTNPAWRLPSWAWRSGILLGLGVGLYYLNRLRRGDYSK